MCVIALVYSSTAAAQSLADNALLFGRTSPGGSARMQALGGTQVALGGDYSTALSNPAGLGMYNRSELTFSMGTTFKNHQTSYLGTSTDASQSNFNIPGFSLVLHFEPAIEPQDNKGFLGGTLGIAFTRINDLHYKYNYSGSNTESSIIDFFLDESNNGGNPIPEENYYDPNFDEFYSLTALALDNFLILPNYENNELLFYGSDLNPYPEETRIVNQNENIHRTGAQYQWSIAYGANFSDRFFVGGNLGIATVRYKLEQLYRESDYQFLNGPDPNYNPLDYMTIDESLSIEGAGVNLTLGLTYRPVDFLQIGTSFTTPTLYQLTDTYYAGMTAEWLDYDPSSSSLTEDLLSEYSLTTPLKFSAGVAFLSKFGFISGDLELINYSKAKYTSDLNGGDYSIDNGTTRDSYQSVINFRTGAEFRYELFRFRAGYSLMNNPYTSDLADGKITSISGGAGIRGNRFYADVAVVTSKTQAARIPYYAERFTPVAQQKSTVTSAMVTVGYTF